MRMPKLKYFVFRVTLTSAFLAILFITGCGKKDNDKFSKSGSNPDRTKFPEYAKTIRLDGKHGFKLRFPFSQDTIAFSDCYHIIYNDKMRIKKIEHLIDGIIRPDTIFNAAIIEITYDEKSEKRLFYDQYGEPIENNSGVYGELYKYDDKGRRVTLAGLNRFGGITENIFGVEIEVFEVDRDGKCKKTTFFDEDFNKIADDTGFHGYNHEYDPDGNEIERSSFDLEGSVVGNRQQIAIYRWKYDENGNIIKVSYHNKNGYYQQQFTGVSFYTFKYDESGNLIEQQSYTDEEMLTDDNRSAAIYRWKYDEKSRRIEESLFGIDGIPVSDKFLGAHIIRWDYDDNLNTFTETYWNTDGKLALNSANIFSVEKKFDPSGNLISIKCLDEKGQLKLNEKTGNIAAVIYTYDEKGRWIEKRFHGELDKLKEDVTGISIIHRKYNELGLKIEESYHGCHNQLKGPKKLENEPNNLAGIAIIRWEYDEKGNKISESYLDAEEKLKGDSHGIAMKRWKYNDDGEIIGLELLDKNMKRKNLENTFDHKKIGTKIIEKKD
ncbi:MAG: hypothetical protein H8D42_04555 [Candidatus Marinimicrobia bacterium]|nr:hypothetical protein [Candidatus Neomarinimicrobiota bacterium]